MSPARWLPTFLAYPVGGWLAIQVAGPLVSPGAALLGGAVVGAVLGAAQWLALRRVGVGPLLVVVTALAMAAGTALALAATGGSTAPGALAVTGAVAGTVVGSAQSLVLVRGRLHRAVWAATVGAGWALAWLTSWAIGVDVDRAYHSFGASGALVATVVTGLVLRALLGAQAPSARSLAVQPSVAPAATVA